MKEEPSGDSKELSGFQAVSFMAIVTKDRIKDR
jgi:hypothetical protein